MCVSLGISTIDVEPFDVGFRRDNIVESEIEGKGCEGFMENRGEIGLISARACGACKLLVRIEMVIFSSGQALLDQKAEVRNPGVFLLIKDLEAQGECRIA